VALNETCSKLGGTLNGTDVLNLELLMTCCKVLLHAYINELVVSR